MESNTCTSFLKEALNLKPAPTARPGRVVVWAPLALRRCFQAGSQPDADRRPCRAGLRPGRREQHRDRDRHRIRSRGDCHVRGCSRDVGRGRQCDLADGAPSGSFGRIGRSLRQRATRPQSGSLANAYKYVAPSGQFGIQYFPVSEGAVTDIAAGADGNLWLLNNGGENLVPWSISKITTSGVFTNYPLPDPGLLTDIAPGPDGNLWYTREREPFTSGPAAVGRITPAGAATEFPLDPLSDPNGITAGLTAPWFGGERFDVARGESRRAVRSPSSSLRPSRMGSRSARTARCGSPDVKTPPGIARNYCPPGCFRTSQPPILSTTSVRRRSSRASTATSGSNTSAA